MKKLLVLILTIAIQFNADAQQKLTKVWETTKDLATPESVLPDLKRKILYVSLIDGAPWEADGKGGIAKVGLDGKVVDSYWVKGLDAPKGLGLFENKLYVADMNKVAIVNVETGKVEQRIEVAGAKKLNDITVDDRGVVYVSDSEEGKVYKVQNGKAGLHLSGFAALNGVKAVGDDLVVAAGSSLYRVDPKRELKLLGRGFALGGDGVEPIKAGGYIVSCWGGLIYYVDVDRKVQLLLDSREEKINTADIGYNAESNMIYVPTFFKNSVVAYSLK